MTIRFLAEAEAELADAVAHYDGLLPGLGAEFALEVRNSTRKRGNALAVARGAIA